MPSHDDRPISLLACLAVAGVAALAGLLLTRRVVPAAPPGRRTRDTRSAHPGPRPGFAAISPEAARQTANDGQGPFDYVRPAGPEAMRDPPRRGWDRLDEASDESFPASDPSARY